MKWSRAGLHGAANTRLPDGARRTLEIDQAWRGREIRSRGSFLALGLGCGEVRWLRLASQTRTETPAFICRSRPLREARGTRRAEPRRRGCRSRFERTHHLSGRRLPASSGGGGYSTSEGREPSDDGGSLSDASRRADGLATSAVLDPISELQATYRTRSQPRGDDSKHLT